MPGATSIEWTKKSWPTVGGCDLESPGCAKCYAMKMAFRLEAMGQAPYAGLTKKAKGGAVWTGKLRLMPEHIILAPLGWTKGTRIFCNSMSDLFHVGVPWEWIDLTFAIMAATQRHTYQVLTKRAANMFRYMSRDPEEARRAIIAAARTVNYSLHGLPLHEWLEQNWPGWPLPNVWGGVSIEDNKRASERLPYLMTMPLAHRFVSMEPLLGFVDLTSIPLPEYGLILNALTGYYTAMQPCGIKEFAQRMSKLPAIPDRQRLEWAIMGGESGPGARAADIESCVYITARNCRDAGVPFFFKQWGAWLPFRRQYNGFTWKDGAHEDGAPLTARVDGKLYRASSIQEFSYRTIGVRVGKKIAGNMVDGVQYLEIPT